MTSPSLSPATDMLQLAFHLPPILAAFKLAAVVVSASSAVSRQWEPAGDKSVIVQMFQWSWDSIATECQAFLGPAGYGYVQVSPPQEHVLGAQWWTDYQPVSYNITSKRGNRDQFRNMVSKCHSAGVGIIVDTIFNHMAGSETTTGVAGTPYTHYNYPGIYKYTDFHHCGLEPGDDIVNYTSRVEVQTCELVNLADLATETEYVRGRLAQYANDLLSLGVDGFRLDAAKHIAATDISNILGRLTSQSAYITQEVIWGAGEEIQPPEYLINGAVQEFRYTTALRDAFLGGGISNLQNLDNQGWVPSDQANTFVANHDTERNGGSLNWNSPSNTYINAMAFSLAHPYGTPSILSSYSGFTNTDLGAPNNGSGTCSSNGGTGGWLCQHRLTSISGMVGFRNTVGSAPMTNWVSPQSQQIAFGRGSAGYFALNNADTAWAATFTTSLPAGSYCDVISGVSSGGKCTGIGVTVGSTGSFGATVPARSAIAIHIGAKGSGSGLIPVSFAETANTTYGENIFLVGSIAQLGNWDPSSSLPLSPASYPAWTATVNLPPNTAFQYKFIRKETDGSVIWESDPNRQDIVPASGTQTLGSTWR